MKLKLLSLILMLVYTLNLQAQNNFIKNNSKWFDGSVLYTANWQNGIIFFTGESELNKECSFMLKVEEDVDGYILAQSFENENAPLRAQFGWLVEYIRKDGMNFLAVKNTNGEIVWTLILTPDNLKNSLAQERYAEKQPVEEMLSNYLMNTTYLSRFSIIELKGMESILNEKQNKTIIEKTNLSLIRNEQKIPKNERIKTGQSIDKKEVVVDDGRIYVTNEKEFFDALSNGANIVLKEGTQLNLSKILNNQNYFNTEQKQYMEYALNIKDTKKTYIVSEDVFNGRQLTIMNLHDVTITGEKNTAILVEPPYAFVLNFINCLNVTIENITMGHIEEGYCTGGVIGITECDIININQCDLFGCGAYGIIVNNTNKLFLNKTIIRDCSYGIMEIRRGMNIHFKNCDFIRNEKFTMVYINETSENVSFNNCRFAQNKGLLFDFGNKVQMLDCEIHHSEEDKFGTENMIEYVGGRNRWFIDDKPLQKRNIGPDLKH